jgi:hypoxanthine phosphoribosyltransferase
MDYVPLIAAGRIKTRVAELGLEIDTYYREARAGDEPVLVLPILTGGMFFAADLLRAMKTPVEIAPVKVSSYGDEQESSGAIRWELTPPPEKIPGRWVLLIDDVLDSGLTLRRVGGMMKALGARHVGAAVIADKLRDRPPLDRIWSGFPVKPDHFLVGYGLDDRGVNRNLAGIDRLL